MKNFKLQLSPIASDIFVTLYIMLTLFGRIYLEPQLNGNFFISICLGLFMLLFLWALVKSNFIKPTWFGLMGKDVDTDPQA